MHVFHVVSTWLGYTGLVCSMLIGAINGLWPEKGRRHDRRR